MLRRVLTAYLAFLMAVAPCLCCCTAGRLLAAAPPEPAAPACCCHDADPQPAPTTPKAPAPEPRCPCRHHTDMQGQVTVASDPIDLNLLRAVLDAAPVAATVVASSPVADRLALAEVREPFPSMFDLLHLHHRLRC